MNKVNEASPATSGSGLERLVRRLEHQYTTQNDGGGHNGYCRVNNGDLLTLLRHNKDKNTDAVLWCPVHEDTGEVDYEWLHDEIDEKPHDSISKYQLVEGWKWRPFRINIIRLDEADIDDA